MKSYEEIIGEAVRVEYDEFTDRLCLVFEIVNPKMKQEIKANWTKDIEFKMVNKKLILKEGE